MLFHALLRMSQTLLELLGPADGKGRRIVRRRGRDGRGNGHGRERYATAASLGQRQGGSGLVGRALVRLRSDCGSHGRCMGRTYVVRTGVVTVTKGQPSECLLKGP